MARLEGSRSAVSREEAANGETRGTGRDVHVDGPSAAGTTEETTPALEMIDSWVCAVEVADR